MNQYKNNTTEEMKNKIGHHKKNRVLAISFGHFCHDIFSGFLSPLLPILIKEFQLTYALAGGLTVCLRIPSLFNPIIGYLADRFNFKFFVILAPLITAITMSLLGLASEYFFLVLLLLIAGFSSALFHVPSPVFIKRVSGKKRGQGMSFFMIGGELARTVSPVLLMSVIYLWGTEHLYRLIPLGGLASLFLYYKLRRIKIAKKDFKRQVENRTLKYVRKMVPVFASITGVLTAKSLTASVLTAYLPAYLHQKGVSLFLAGSSLSILAIAAFMGVAVSGPLSDRFGRKSILLFTQISTPLIMLVFLHANGWILAPLLFLLGVFGFSTTPVVMALVQDKGTASPALFNGIYMSMNFLISSLTVLLIGKCADLIGLAYSFHLTAILAFCLFPVLFLLKEN